MSYSAVPDADDDEDTQLEKASSIPIYRNSLNAEHEWGSTSTSTIKHGEDTDLDSIEQGGFGTGQDKPLGWLQRLQTSNLWQTQIRIPLPLLMIGSFMFLLLLSASLAWLYHMVDNQHAPSESATSTVPSETVPEVYINPMSSTIPSDNTPVVTDPPSMNPQVSQGPVVDLEEIDGPFDPVPLQQLCAATVWREGLYFGHLPGAPGGAANIRNIFSAGLRLAIEAGAAAFVMPRMATRSTSNLAEWQFGFTRDFTYFFDREHFKATLALACPQMRIYDDLEDLKQFAWGKEQVTLSPLYPKSLDPGLVEGFFLSHPELWRAELDDYLVSINRTFTPEDPTLLLMDNTLLSWPVQYDNPGIVKTLSRPFRTTPHIRQIVIAVLSALKARFSLDIDIAKGTFSSSGYFGCHLRTEADAVGGGFGSYQYQADSFLTIAHQGGNGYKVIYVASGDANEVNKLRAQTLGYNMTVVTKMELLSGIDLEALQSLSWDQQGLVDYEVMLRAGFFAGTGASSFSYNVALKRHAVLMKDEEEGRGWTPLERGGGSSGIAWWGMGGEYEKYGPGDNLSMVLTGANVVLFGHTIWP